MRPKTRSNFIVFRPMRDFLAIAAIVGVVWIHGNALRAQSGNGGLKLDTGKDIYMAGCVSCHGPDGKGQPET